LELKETGRFFFQTGGEGEEGGRERTRSLPGCGRKEEIELIHNKGREKKKLFTKEGKRKETKRKHFAKESTEGHQKVDTPSGKMRKFIFEEKGGGHENTPIAYQNAGKRRRLLSRPGTTSTKKGVEIPFQPNREDGLP